MSKRRGSRREEVDKPAFALGEEPGLREGERPRDKEARMELGARLDEGAFAKLKQLKAQIDDTAAQTQVKSAKKQSRKRVSASEEEDEESFADLLNPKDDPEASFEDLLKRSKLDWRSFK
jgi:hypothetical protein